MKRHNTLLVWICLGSLVSACIAQHSSSVRPYRIPEYGVDLEIPRDAKVGGTGIFVHGVPNGDGMPPHEFGFLPKYSSRYLGGVRYRCCLRIFLLTSSAKTDEGRAKGQGWTEKPSLDLYPFHEAQKSNLVKAVERLYFQLPTPWEEIRMIRIAGQDALEMNGWERRWGKRDDYFFQEIRALPVANGKVVLMHSTYGQMSRKEIEQQRRVVADIVKSLRLTKPIDG